MKKLMVCLVVLLLGACTTPKIQLVSRQEIPLNEYTLAGQANQKILVITVKGKISDDPQPGLLFTKPSMLQEIVSQLRRAEQDKQIRALLLKIDSPGGTVTASDVLYHEIAEYKKRAGVKVIAALMNVGASGGYYIALPADRILAHPTTVTGSVGVVFFQPKVIGLFDKIGVEVDVSKSGQNKDMGSPFRPSTAAERNILQGLTDRLGNLFIQRVKTHRRISADALNEIASARIYLADEALDLGLIDRIGYLSDAIEEARRLAGLPADAKVIVYRRTEFPDDNLYNPMVTSQSSAHPTLINLGLPASATQMTTGFYYLWAPGADNE
jgi:protease-4